MLKDMCTSRGRLGRLIATAALLGLTAVTVGCGARLTDEQVASATAGGTGGPQQAGAVGETTTTVAAGAPVEGTATTAAPAGQAPAAGGQQPAPAAAGGTCAPGGQGDVGVTAG